MNDTIKHVFRMIMRKYKSVGVSQGEQCNAPLESPSARIHSAQAIKSRKGLCAKHTTPWKIIYAGTPQFAVPALQALINQSIDYGYEICAVFTQPDRPAGRGQQLTASPVKLLAQQYNIPVHQPMTLKDSDTQKIIADYQADIMIVAAYGLLLPQAVLDMPRLGCINIHASWLPRWRGAAPIQRAILAGDTETGISIMQMAAGMDTGDVICLAGCPISNVDTTESLHDKLASLGAKTILEVLPTIIDGTAIRTPQQEHLVTHAAKLSKSEAKLNWQQSAIELDRAIRAYNPWPVAQTELEGHVIRIWQAVVVMAAETDAVPGTICAVNKEGIDVITSKGILRLQKIQFAGKNVVTVAEVLNAHQVLFTVGQRFS